MCGRAKGHVGKHPVRNLSLPPAILEETHPHVSHVGKQAARTFLSQAFAWRAAAASSGIWNQRVYLSYLLPSLRYSGREGPCGLRPCAME